MRKKSDIKMLTYWFIINNPHLYSRRQVKRAEKAIKEFEMEH